MIRYGYNGKSTGHNEKSRKALKAGELADMVGIDKREIDKVMKVLKKEKKIVSPKRCFWEPK